MAKPKFRVGQVVAIKGDEPLVRISDVHSQNNNYFYFQGFASVGWSEKELRALNAREIDPRPQKRVKHV